MNAISVGMDPEPEQSPIPVEMLADKPIIFDVVPRPKITTLIEMAKVNGCCSVPGVAMIHHLAAPTLEWLTGERVSIGVLRAHVA